MMRTTLTPLFLHTGKAFFGMVIGAACVLAPVGHAQGRDFSGGFSNTGQASQAATAGNDWAERQAETAAEAARALATPAKRSHVAPGTVGPGDKIRLMVFGEEDLSGEFEVDSTGSLSMPLIGEVKVLGMPPREVEKRIAQVLEQGYLKNPRVSVEVLNFRPFFILGEVNKPGSYPYANEMTVINAVALGGGYTTRAKTGKVMVRRSASPEKEDWAREDEMVYPGDVLRVEERFF